MTGREITVILSFVYCSPAKEGRNAARFRAKSLWIFDIDWPAYSVCQIIRGRISNYHRSDLQIMVVFWSFWNSRTSTKCTLVMWSHGHGVNIAKDLSSSTFVRDSHDMLHKTWYSTLSVFKKLMISEESEKVQRIRLGRIIFRHSGNFQPKLNLRVDWQPRKRWFLQKTNQRLWSFVCVIYFKNDASLLHFVVFFISIKCMTSPAPIASWMNNCAGFPVQLWSRQLNPPPTFT